MGRQIIPQPDGRYAIFSSVTDTFEAYDCEKQEVIDFFVDEAAEEMAQRISSTLRQIDDDGPRRVYAQFALNFDEAYDKHLGHGGTVLPFEEVDEYEFEQCPNCGNPKRVGVNCVSQQCLIDQEQTFA